MPRHHFLSRCPTAGAACCFLRCSSISVLSPGEQPERGRTWPSRSSWKLQLEVELEVKELDVELKVKDQVEVKLELELEKKELKVEVEMKLKVEVGLKLRGV